MNTIEDQVRDALDSHASAHSVDTDALWRATEPRLVRRRARPVLLGLAAASVGVAAAFAVGALTSPDPTLVPAGGGPSPRPSPSATKGPNPPIAGGRLTAREAEEVVKAARRHEQAGTSQLEPIEVVEAKDGSRWALAAYRQAPGAPRNSSGEPMLCYGVLWLSGPQEVGDSVGCSGTTLPEPEDAGNALLSSTQALGLPVGGDGHHVETGYEFSAGNVVATASRVVGVDAAGQRHEAILAGDGRRGEPRQYFLVTKTSVTLTKVEAYGERGELLTSVPVTS